MPKRKIQFSENEIYHITLRRVGDKLLFKDNNDYYRGIFSIFEFNDSKPVEIRKRRAERACWKKSIQELSGVPDSAKHSAKLVSMVEADKRKRLVDILAFCLMPNHIHLLLKEIQEGGISKFMQKFGCGFARYSKERYKYKMKGHFFQDRFMAVHIEDDEQLKVVFVYIHTNPVAVIEPGWKEKGIIDSIGAFDYIENYKWSSCQDYIGKKNFPSVTQRDLLLEVMGEDQGCKEAIRNWVEYKGDK